MLKGTAADALRPYTPKKIKPMLIKKTKLFHKLSFGIRWNMRDSVRHKSRTAMSLIGIAGALLLGVVVLAYLLKALAGKYEMKMAVGVGTIVCSIVLTVGMALLVSLMVSGKNKKIDMVEALKGVE